MHLLSAVKTYVSLAYLLKIKVWLDFSTTTCSTSNQFFFPVSTVMPGYGCGGFSGASPGYEIYYFDPLVVYDK